jgi:hypothetical protein
MISDDHRAAAITIFNAALIYPHIFIDADNFVSVEFDCE